jgi:hypothetical protein
MAGQWDEIRAAAAAAPGFSIAERIADARERTEQDLADTLAALDRGNEPTMTEPINEPEPVNPGEDPGVDPPPDDDGDAVDRAEAIDEPEHQEAADPTWIGSDVP